jgi:hypothetical protein
MILVLITLSWKREFNKSCFVIYQCQKKILNMGLINCRHLKKNLDLLGQGRVGQWSWYFIFYLATTYFLFNIKKYYFNLKIYKKKYWD